MYPGPVAIGGMMRKYTMLSAIGAIALAGCSGGTSTPTPTPTPSPTATNRAPAFTSVATASIAENTTAVLTATASDPDGNPLSFSIVGGADAARFAITPAGALTFAPAPNFDLPTDANGDNVYEVLLLVSDGSLSATQNVTVTVTNSREGIAVRRVGTGFNAPQYVVAIPGSSEVYVAEYNGSIWRFNPATGVKTLLFIVGDINTRYGGLTGMALLPDFATSGRFMVSAMVGVYRLELRQYVLRAAGSPPSLFSTFEVGRAGGSEDTNDNGGWMAFGPDGYLYVATGADSYDTSTSLKAQDRHLRWGKILRLKVEVDPYAGASPSFFRPAPGNPFTAGNGDPYVFALGLHTPSRGSFAPDGRLIIADIGQFARHEINLIRTDQPGLNFGWPYFEGSRQHTDHGNPPAGITPPVTEYENGTGPRRGGSVTGGNVYRGPVASLTGSYVFGDYETGNIWSVPYASLVTGSTLASSNYERRNEDFKPDAGEINRITSFGEDAAGNLFIVDSDGEIFMVTPG